LATYISKRVHHRVKMGLIVDDGGEGDTRGDDAGDSADESASAAASKAEEVPLLPPLLLTPSP
jgi:hypothetical protein